MCEALPSERNLEGGWAIRGLISCEYDCPGEGGREGERDREGGSVCVRSVEQEKEREKPFYRSSCCNGGGSVVFSACVFLLYFYGEGGNGVVVCVVVL